MKKIAKAVIMAGLLSLGSVVCSAQGLTVCTSTSYTIPSAEGVSGATYRWLENGAEIPGANDDSYTNLEGKPAGTYVYVRRAHTDACGWQNSNAFIVSVSGQVDAPAITKPAAGCAGSDYVFTVPAVGGVSYEWVGGGTANANSYTYSSATAGALTVTVRAIQQNEVTCRSAASGATVTAYALPEISAQPASTSTCSGRTVSLSVTASNATAWQWKKNGANVSEGSGGTTSNYTTAPLSANATYTVVVANGSCSVTSDDAVVSMKTDGCGVNQPQGSCTFTQPPVVGTFANFHETGAYTSSTYVTLTDERDSKNYTVVKIGGRWIMGQNLNYQKGLTWQANSNSPSTGTGQNTALIGHFWCPGGDNGGTASTSTKASCDVYGALYSWETAMSFDGKGAWTEASGSYCTGAANTDNCTKNHGRSSSGSGTGGRGICPLNWHVPTDFEWGVIFDTMEGSGTAHQNASSTGWYGTNAGKYAKSKCMCSSGSCNNDTNVSWYYHSSAQGTDVYDFRGLPAGYRLNDGSSFSLRGHYVLFWSSSVASSSDARRRSFCYNRATVERHGVVSRSIGLSVRCIRD